MTNKHQVFHDKSPYGERHWQFYKTQNIILADYVDMFDGKLAQKIRDCSTYLEFKRDSNTGYLRLFRCFYCKNKLCYLCSWRRSLRDFHQLKSVLNQADEEVPNCRFIFLTLTSKSSTKDNLRKNIRNMNRAVSKLFQYKKIRNSLIGYVRSSEVTVNKAVSPEDIRYHQHVHIIAMVKDYFKKGHYLKQDDWANYWQKAMQLDYKPIVNVKAIKEQPKKHLTAIEAASRELSKYVVKPSLYLATAEDEGYQSQDTADEHNISVIETLNNQLHGLRHISYGLLLRKVRTELFGKDKDIESDDDLNNISQKESSKSDKNSDVVRVFWNEFNENYYKI